MKNFGLIFFVLSLSLNAYATKNYSTLHQKIELRFQSELEPIALDAAWINATTFKIGTTQQSENHEKFAAYVCKSIHNYGLYHPKLTVRIINFPRLMATGHQAILAEKNCSMPKAP
ncbi:hypothetical protein ACMXYX_01145 [Neptuniibacter sp. QD72_48]|uniref:hypothetical protein n=1 Tax=unclassified Neptuniibacter TaxID=2630693 RepID=UPI0039F7219A